MDCNWDNEDGACVERCLEGDSEAFDELVVRYQKPVFNAIYHLVHDYEDARELTQSAFLRVFMNLDKFDPQRRFFSWLYRIAVNEAINFLAARKVTEPIDPSLRSPSAGPDAQLEAKDIVGHIQGGILVLSPDYRAVVVLRHFLDLSYDEGAEILEIPVKTFKSRLYSARQLLREYLIAHGYGTRRDSSA
jgi:RNA polymerase sigma-70 factor, ECF subfamily